MSRSPISRWMGRRGPGSIFFFQNIIASSPGHAKNWEVTPHVNGAPGVFKVGISLKNWQWERMPEGSKITMLPSGLQLGFGCVHAVLPL